MYTDREISKKVINLLGNLYLRGLSKENIALQLGITTKTIYKWEHKSIPTATNYLNLLELSTKERSA